MPNADETLSKYAAKAEENAEEGKEDKIDMPAQEEEKKITKAMEAKKSKIRVQPPFPRRVARNMEVEEMSELLKVFKEEDSGMFLISCANGSSKIGSVILNMEDFHNVMNLTMYQELKIGLLKPIRATIRLVDMSRPYPVGIPKDVLVKLDGETVIFNFAKAEEHPPDLEIVDLEGSSEQMVEDVSIEFRIQDECDQVIQGGWAEHTPLAKEVLKALEAEVEIPHNTSSLQTPTLSMEDETMPVISVELIIEGEGKIQDLLGQDVEDYGYYAHDNDA